MTYKITSATLQIEKSLKMLFRNTTKYIRAIAKDEMERLKIREQLKYEMNVTNIEDAKRELERIKCS